MDYDKLFAADQEFVRRILLEQGSFRQMFVIHAKDGEILPVLGEAGSPDEKAVLYKMIQIIVIAHEATAMSSLAEAWLATASEDGTIGDRPVRDREDRIEVVSVIMATRENGKRRVRASLREIQRDAMGVVTGFGPERIDPDDGTVAAGAILDLFPIDKPPRSVVAAAKIALDGLRDIGSPTRH